MTRMLIRSGSSPQEAYRPGTHTPRPEGRQAFQSAGVSVRPREISPSNGEVASACRTTCTGECRRVKPIAAMLHVRCVSDNTSGPHPHCDNLVRSLRAANPEFCAPTEKPRLRSLITRVVKHTPRIRDIASGNADQSRGDFPAGHSCDSCQSGFRLTCSTFPDSCVLEFLTHFVGRPCRPNPCRVGASMMRRGGRPVMRRDCARLRVRDCPQQDGFSRHVIFHRY